MFFSHMRIARPVTNLEHSCHLYHQGLGLQRIGGFAEHDGFSGVMMGHPALPWHIEFTRCHTHPLPPSPGKEDLLVFYCVDKTAWRRQCSRMKKTGFTVVSAFNPYWDQKGCTFVDPDGYRVVLQNTEGPATHSNGEKNDG